VGTDEGAGKVAMLNIASPDRPRVVSVVDLGRLSGPHYLRLTGDERLEPLRVGLSHHFAFGHFHLRGDRHFLRALDAWRRASRELCGAKTCDHREFEGVRLGGPVHHCNHPFLEKSSDVRSRTTTTNAARMRPRAC